MITDKPHPSQLRSRDRRVRSSRRPAGSLRRERWRACQISIFRAPRGSRLWLKSAAMNGNNLSRHMDINSSLQHILFYPSTIPSTTALVSNITTNIFYRPLLKPSNLPLSHPDPLPDNPALLQRPAENSPLISMPIPTSLPIQRESSSVRERPRSPHLIGRRPPCCFSFTSGTGRII